MIPSLGLAARAAPPVTARHTVGALAVIGAVLVAIGVTLPWLTFFAGLQAISALGSPNGTLLFVGAAVAGLLGIATVVRPSRRTRDGLLAIGIVLTAFSAYLVVGLITVFHEVSADPLTVAALGPGLVLVGVGSVAVLATALLPD